MPHLRWRKRRGRRRPVLALAAAAALAATALPAAAATIEATADASRDSTYAWTIEKTADTTQVTLGPGQSVTVTYTVTATPTLTTAGWSANGEILVTNDQQSTQSLEAVTASVAGIGPADITCPESVDLPHPLTPGDEIACTWSIVLPDAATRVATTTATVDGTDHTATATIDFTTASDNAVDACADVYDLNIDFLDTVCANAGPTTFTFPVTFGPFEECVDREVENIAWTETHDTLTVAEDSWTFTVLCPRPEPNERTYHWQIAKTSSQPTLTLQPGQSATVTYTVTVASTGFTDSDPNAEETVEIDECVDVTDTLAGTLGTVCADAQPRTFTYTLTVGPYTTCGPRTIPNTATYRGTDTDTTGQATAALAVDVPCAQPAFALVIDEDSIDNGSAPNSFSAQAVNDQIAKIGLRALLPAFSGANVGKTITLHTGQVGDEGWFALKSAPASWKAAGPTGDGVRNFIAAGPGLGSPSSKGDREALLDKVPNVTPLRATGLKLLLGRRVCAVVYDSDVSMNYGPLNGSLKGANLGRVAFEVVSVTKLTGGSSSSLPKTQVRILDADAVCAGPLELFAAAPAPQSSSLPADVTP